MEIIISLVNLPFWSKVADLHGMWSMLSLVLFGAGITLYFVSKKNVELVSWLKITLILLFSDLILLDIFGLTIYIPYRAEGGPRTVLKSSEATAWLHSVIFEHKEFLAFAPPLIILVALAVTRILGKNFNDEDNLLLRRSIIFSLIVALIFVLIVAAEAVIVTKAAPLE